ncbi:c-type cytochrome [Tropicibacter naphthalenivorans]|uniref:Putative bifunctional cbb3-type cytochrome c oxidase subunit II/cytochrome c n=1 Tax=Tropicibacter naphthalenivorans TaxID=441103 RepID=A0A0P1GT45_9RHOB|nr:cytochrome c [Tropicibacter naphthalenivorans]CUH78360.1 putative bifunctional cbb3-type cytochrome c oxidase subunit II/cytochrome c [Tropicibacter naphthalenivorans]SMC79920.1 Cytochrome c, mono-and diheme variants [Tropicibacter naphthalenivorans]
MKYALALALLGASPALAAGILPYDDAARVAEGQVIYAETCASCHGADLEGEDNWREADADGYLPAPPHDETGHTWHHPDPLLVQIVTLGTEAIVGGTYQSNMIGFGDVLTEDQILNVLAYIKSTWPQQVIDMHNEMNTRAGVN